MTTLQRIQPEKGCFFPPFKVDFTRSIPIHRQLYDWYQAAVADGRLRPGQRVPSTRSLAAELGVSRAPVLAAFEQLLAEGYFEAIIGAGTRISDTIPEMPAAPVADRSRSRPAKAGARSGSKFAAGLTAGNGPWWNNEGIFRANLPALDHFPARTWASLLSRHASRTTNSMMAYGDVMGHLPLREAIARYLGAARAVCCKASQIMIVSGSQHGLQITARALLDAGDQVWMEEPGYPGAHAAFAMAGARMAPVPVDQAGMKIEHGVAHFPEARLAYVTPSHHYPLGTGMSAARRMQLLSWAARRGAWIVEDDYDSEYRFGAHPMPALQGLDTDERVIYLGTFSKVMFPGIRLGYIIIPEDLIPSFRAVREATDIFAPPLAQAALADFIAEGHFSRHLRKMRTLYMRRRAALAEAMHRRVGDSFRIIGIDAGMHLTGFLPEQADDVHIANRAGAMGVSAIPLSTCYLAESSPGLILGYGNASETQIERGTALLAGVIEAAGGSR